MRLKQFKLQGCTLWLVVSCYLVYCYTVHYFVARNLKAAQMNVQCSLIWKLILYKFELGHNDIKTIKHSKTFDLDIHTYVYYTHIVLKCNLKIFFKLLYFPQDFWLLIHFFVANLI